MKALTITKEQQYKMEAKARRDAEIANQSRVNYNRVFKSKKTYSRKNRNIRIEG